MRFYLFLSPISLDLPTKEQLQKASMFCWQNGTPIKVQTSLIKKRQTLV